MKNIFLVFLFTLSYLFANESKYYDIDEYVNYANQKNISEKFIKLIQSKSKKLENRNKKIRIALVYPGKQLTDYWIRSKISFEKRLNELNINYHLVLHFTKPHIEIKEQSKLLLSAMKKNTDYLVFVLDANEHSKFIERIISKKDIKLILQNITTPLKIWKDRQPFLYVGFDHMLGSQMLADYYIKKTGGKGKYAVLYTSNGYVSHMRGTKFIEYISNNSDLKVVHEYYTNTSKKNAKMATFDLLKIDKDIKFIYACSTEIALGVMEALKEKNLTGKILVNGWGGGEAELEAISKDNLDVTVMRMNDDNGVAMAEAIKLDLAGNANKVPTIFSGDMRIVEKGIKKDELETLKKRAFRYTYENKK
jgi:autoinducer 2-binding protein LuxP